MKPTLNFLGKFDFIGLLLLRIGCGVTIGFYGLPNFMGGPDVWKEIGRTIQILNPTNLNPNIYLVLGLISAMTQVFGGLALVIGLFTRVSALLITIVISFAITAMIQESEVLLHVIIAGQLAFATLSLAFVGPGRLSLDRKGV